MKRILLVEDDRAVALAVIYSLKKEGFEVDHATNLKSARNMLNDSIHLILLDVMLPDGDGYELCSEIRKAQNNIKNPKLIITIRGVGYKWAPKVVS